jgi:hypothetical protein
VSSPIWIFAPVAVVLILAFIVHERDVRAERKVEARIRQMHAWHEIVQGYDETAEEVEYGERPI